MIFKTNNIIEKSFKTFHLNSLNTAYLGRRITIDELTCCCFSVTKSYPTLWNPVGCSTPDFNVLHYLLEFAQTHVHWVSDAIQPSNPLLPLFLLLTQYFPGSGSFQMSQFFTSDGQSIGASAWASVLPMNIQGWFPLGLIGLISWQSKGLSSIFSNTTAQKHQFFSAQLSSQSNSHIHTWPLEKPQPWLDGPLLAK